MKVMIKKSFTILYVFCSGQAFAQYGAPILNQAVNPGAAQMFAQQQTQQVQQYQQQIYEIQPVPPPNTSSQSRSKTNNSTHSFQSGGYTSPYYKQGEEPCWDAAASYHNVDPWLLYSIAYVESRFKPDAINKNKNGSYDMGMMQINSIWLPTLQKHGINTSVLHNACASTYIGAWILSKNIQKYGYTWKAIGAYNSATPSIGYKYAQKVYAAHKKFTNIYQYQKVNVNPY